MPKEATTKRGKTGKVEKRKSKKGKLKLLLLALREDYIEHVADLPLIRPQRTQAWSVSLHVLRERAARERP